MAKNLDKVVNKAKALEIHQGLMLHLNQRLNNHDREAEAGKKQPLAWPWQLIFLALGVPDASLQYARLCG